jgi:hypothetical protein
VQISENCKIRKIHFTRDLFNDFIYKDFKSFVLLKQYSERFCCVFGNESPSEEPFTTGTINNLRRFT